MSRPFVAITLIAWSVSACESAEPHTFAQDERVGVLTYAVGAEVREVGFAAVDCTPEPGGVTRVELWHDRVIAGPQKEPQRPRVLIARLRDDAVVEAHAFAPSVEHEGRSYSMLQIVGGTCRVEASELRCNDSTLVGWLGAGRPRSSFKAPVACEAR